MSETGPGPEESVESQATQEPTTRGRRTKKVLGVAAEELKDWRGERRDAAAERRAELRAAADEAQQAHFDPILTQVEGQHADASGTFGGDKQTGTESPRDVDALTRMAVAERDDPEPGSEWPLDGLRRRVEAMPGGAGQWRENREARREQRAREAVAAANTVAEAEAASTPEMSDSQQRADKYLEDLEREKIFAGARKGISSVNIEQPDNELRQRLYDKLGVREAERWVHQSDATKSKSDIWKGWEHPLFLGRAAKYAKERLSGIAPISASGSHFEVRRYLLGQDNETVIEEVFHQLKVGFSDSGEAGDLSLASTMLVHVKGGAYESKKGKLVPTKAFRSYQLRPIVGAPAKDSDPGPGTEATLPFEGPGPGSLPDHGEFPLHSSGEHEDAESVEEYRLPPAPDLGPRAVAPTPRPVERRSYAPESKAETEPKSKPSAKASSKRKSEPHIETVSAPLLEAEPDAEPASTVAAARPVETFGGPPENDGDASEAESNDLHVNTGEKQLDYNATVLELVEAARKANSNFGDLESGQLLDEQVRGLVGVADTLEKLGVIEKLIEERSEESRKYNLTLSSNLGAKSSSQNAVEDRINAEETKQLKFVRARALELRQEQAKAASAEGSPRAVETVTAQSLETKVEDEAAAETTKIGRKTRKARVQDPKQHPQLIDPSRPVEQRPYDGIARGSRLNESSGESLDTRRASSPEGPPPPAPAAVPERLEYSVETGRILEEDGYSGFSELVHRIQDEDERFGVPLSGELTHAQVGVLLDKTRSSDEVESLEQELVKRDIQHRKDSKSKRPGLWGAGGKLVGRNDSERVLIREIERKYEKLRQAEIDKEAEERDRLRGETQEARPQPQPEVQRAETPEIPLDIPESDAVRRARLARERELNRRGRRGGGSRGKSR